MAIGLDAGTAFQISCRADKIKKQRNAFLSLSGESSTVKRMLKRQNIPYVEYKKKLYIVGSHAFEYANIFNSAELRRPMSQGMLNPQERDSLPILKAIIEELLGAPEKEGEACHYCVPSTPIDKDQLVAYHKDVLKEIVESVGYKAVCIEESVALAFEGLVDHDLTGIAISMGAGMCLSGGTKIPLLNGDIKTIKELADKHSKESFWVYSCRRDGQIVPGLARNPHKVKRTKNIVRLWLDNNEYLDCTKDHLIMMRNGEYKEAQNLIVGDSLMPLYIFDNEIDGRPGYKGVRNNKTKRKKSIHRLVAEEYYNVKLGKNEVVHHIDHNSSNNAPDNLSIMSASKHQKIHKQFIKWMEENLKGKTYEQCYGVDKAKLIKRKQSDAHKNNGDNVGRFKKGCLPHNKGMSLEERYGVIRAEEIRNKIRKNTKKAMIRKDVRETLKIGYAKRNINNHKVVKIECLNVEEDVYDMTVDKYHNFAIDSGIFVHNCNLCIMYAGLPAVSFSVARGGDFIDKHVAIDTGISVAKAQSIKESSDLDLSAINDGFYTEKREDSVIQSAIKSYYGVLISYLLANLQSQFEGTTDAPNFKEPVPIVVGGGTALVKGFIDVFKEQFDRMDFPIPISDIILVEDAHTAIARGCYADALLSEED